MALAGQVATVAQLVGVDAYGLITMIAEAALTVRRNRATCRQLARRVEMIGDLLRQLRAAQAQQRPAAETRRPVEELEETLRRAYLLVRSCQRRGYAYRCFMGTRHADELREVQGEIGFYLQLFPLVSYVDTTLAWARLLGNKADHLSGQEAPMVRQYSVPFLFLCWDGWLALSNLSGSVPRYSVTQSCVVSIVRVRNVLFAHPKLTFWFIRVARLQGIRRNHSVRSNPSSRLPPEKHDD